MIKRVGRKFLKRNGLRGNVQAFRKPGKGLNFHDDLTTLMMMNGLWHISPENVIRTIARGWVNNVTKSPYFEHERQQGLRAESVLETIELFDIKADVKWPHSQEPIILLFPSEAVMSMVIHGAVYEVFFR